MSLSSVSRLHHRCLLVAVIFSLIVLPHAYAQTELATVLGRVTDQSGAVIRGVEVEIRNIDTNLSVTTTTNGEGMYTIPSLRPGRYVISVHKQGFKSVSLTQLTLNIQDNVVHNFALEIGSTAESITVNAESEKINTTDASVSTVVDRNFAENLPLNGRSFQTLIQLTPGVVLTPSTSNDSGQFSVNGQRAASNYWMVDGVSANVGIGINPVGFAGNGLAGSLGSFSALGGTNSLVSVDAMEEFRIQTSTFAPEFGRTPGGQVSITTRSGTNQFHGTLFDYLRNDVFDAKNWFNGYTNSPSLPKAKERQNDFGGTFSGPILTNRTFFFFSYEGLRLRLPQTTLTAVPDLSARRSAVAALQPYLNAFPLPNGSDNLLTGIAQFNGSFSNPASLDAYSLRIDHKLAENFTIFGRYTYSPSEIIVRGGSNFALSERTQTDITLQTGTIGSTWLISSTQMNDLRFNYSRAEASAFNSLDSFGGAIPLVSLPFPSGFTSNNGLFSLGISSLRANLADGSSGGNVQQQANITDSFSARQGTHSLKLGIDFRRLYPRFAPSAYQQTVNFASVRTIVAGSPSVSFVRSNLAPTFLFRNFGAYVQDTWQILPRLTFTYGLRWDVDFVPRTTSGPGLNALMGFDLNDLSKLSLAPPGTQPYSTTFANFAPRLGMAYQLRRNQDWQAVLRGGLGVFYDLATSETGNQVTSGAYPFGSIATQFGGAFPLSPAAMQSPSIVPPNGRNTQTLFGIDPQLRLPYTLEWNIALEQALGRQQTLAASYVGSAGKRLLQTLDVVSPNANLGNTDLVTNRGMSHYDALQLQFRHSLAHGLQSLASYTWSHSTDTASAGSFANAANLLIPSAMTENRASSAFDIRSSCSAGLTYDVPTPKINTVARVILGSWSTENLIIARSAPPVDISDVKFNLLSSNIAADIRPDLKPGVPLYLYGSQYPGGKAFNPAAFADPPLGSNGLPLRQGTVPRNFLRGFGAVQWDFAMHRTFPVSESIKLQFRAELFNILNHPNFGQPVNGFGIPTFGLSTQMLGQSLSPAGVGNGAFSPLYQIGGPRSMQFALKLMF